MLPIADQEERTCVDCGEAKPIMRFHRKRIGTDGRQQYQSYCKDCQRKRGKATADKHGAAYRERNRDTYNIRKREQQRLKKYGVSQGQFDAMLVGQGGRCCICLGAFERPQSACVDHCHKTGKVRGLLCDLCNRAIGYLKDDATRAERLARYLQEGDI